MLRKSQFFVFTIAIIVGVLVGSTFAQEFNFSEDSLIVTDGNLKKLVCADFNNDNAVDIAVTIHNPSINNPIAIYLNNGAGIYNTTPDSLYENPNYAFDLAAADFDNDNNLDLAYTIPDDSSIVIALGNGAGQFTIIDSFKVSTESFVIECAKINNDINEDIIISTRYGRMYVVIGNGDGTFAAPVEYMTGGTGSDIEIFDLNDDGFNDIILGIVNTASMSVYLNDGTGNFPAKHNYYTYRTPGSVKACYFNSDSIPDIVVGSGSWNFDNLMLMLGDTSGSYTLTDTLTLCSNIHQISVGKYNNDEYVDVLVGDRDGIYMVRGNVSGNLAEYDTIDFVASDYQVRDLETKDVNADGKIDLIIAHDNKISIYYNDPAPNSLIENEQQLNSFKLIQNYPNPFNPSTNIDYTLNTNAFVKLHVYNISGQKVATLVNGRQNAGSHSLIWNASNFASGAYFYKLIVDNQTEIKKMLYLK